MRYENETMSIDVRIVEANPSDSDLVGQLVYDLLSELFADQVCH
jgi:hypothetical protein